MIELANCLRELSNMIQAQEKLAKSPVILGMRVMDGPWQNTKFLDVDTFDNQYSGLLIKNGDTLSMVAPFKVVKKENVKK